MSEDSIKINDLILNPRVGSPITFKGKHSGENLSGINLKITLAVPELVQKFEELIAQKIVQIYDPFVKRSYQAILNQLSNSYTLGHPERHYTVELLEIDLIPKCTILEIEGHPFPVLEYIQSEEDDDAIGIHAVLKVTKEQFEDLQKLMKPGAINIKRRDFDDEPIVMRYGGAMYWSEHNEGEELFYKQIVRFFPPELPPSCLNIATQVHQENLFSMVQELIERFEALVIELVQKQVITRENWKGLLDSPRADKLFKELDRVNDASKFLD